MNGSKCSFMVILLLVVVCAAPATWATWIENGNPICTATDLQSEPSIVPSSDGSWILVWWDDRNHLDIDIYAQRVSPTGEVLWAADGVPICTEAGDQMRLDVVADGYGGAIIAWEDERAGLLNADIYVQRINSNGDVLWTPNGAPACTTSGHQQHVSLDTYGEGGAVLAWQDERNGPADIYAQHIDGLGAAQWTINGEVVCSASSVQWFPAIAVSPDSISVITWYDGRSPSPHIYAQSLSATGDTLWAEDGILVCTSSTSQGRPYIAEFHIITSLYVIVWEDWSGTSYDIYAQRISSNGSLLWAPEGAPVCTNSADQIIPRLVMTPDFGTVFVWWDYRNGVDQDVYAQKLASNGSPVWTVNGVAVCDEPGDQKSPEIISDGGTGAIITWADERSGAWDIYAQRLSSSGLAQWTANGLPVQIDPQFAATPRLAPDGTGGAVLTWRFDDDIYAQRIAGTGQWGSAEPVILGIDDVPLDQGGKIQIQWRASALDVLPVSEIVYYSLWRRVPLSSLLLHMAPPDIGAMPLIHENFDGEAVRRVSTDWAAEWIANIPARAFEAYAYTAVSLYDSTGADPGWQCFMVSAHTENQMVFYDSPIDSGYSVDNLSPVPPGGLLAEQSSAPEGLDLSWDENGENDFHHYAIYRGTSEDFVPAPGNLIGTPGAAEFFDEDWRWDSGYWYKIAAVDVHGNESAFAVLGPDEVVGVDTPKIPRSTFLAQNYPNPFTSETQISFGLATPEMMSLKIYDAAGRLIRVLSADDLPAGNYKKSWDGRDASGAKVASGVYFYRLDAGTFTQTRKIVILR